MNVISKSLNIRNLKLKAKKIKKKESITLHKAQRKVAKFNGYSSWPKLIKDNKTESKTTPIIESSPHKKRRLSRGLDELLKKSINNEIFNDEKPIDPKTLNLNAIAVIRSKGGSGEKHVVRRYREKFVEEGSQVLTVKLHSDICNELDRYSDEYGKLLTIQDIKAGKMHGQLIWNWMETSNLNSLLNYLNNKPVVIIFTVGTAGGGGLWDRIEVISDYCQKIIVTVNLDVFFSVMPALGLARDSFPKDILRFGTFDDSKVYEEVTAEKFTSFIQRKTEFNFDTE